jgi:hypothetical protein
MDHESERRKRENVGGRVLRYGYQSPLAEGLGRDKLVTVLRRSPSSPSLFRIRMSQTEKREREDTDHSVSGQRPLSPLAERLGRDRLVTVFQRSPGSPSLLQFS